MSPNITFLSLKNDSTLDLSFLFCNMREVRIMDLKGYFISTTFRFFLFSSIVLYYFCCFNQVWFKVFFFYQLIDHLLTCLNNYHWLHISLLFSACLDVTKDRIQIMHILESSWKPGQAEKRERKRGRKRGRDERGLQSHSWGCSNT